MEPVRCLRFFLQFLVFAGFLGKDLHVQKVKYSYDPSGDITSREKAINMSRSMLKFSQGETQKTETSVYE